MAGEEGISRNFDGSITISSLPTLKNWITNFVYGKKKPTGKKDLAFSEINVSSCEFEVLP